MTLNEEHIRIEDLDTDLNPRRCADNILPYSNLIIWMRSHNFQHDHDAIYCLRDHQLSELYIPEKSPGMVISISRKLLEMINGYTVPLFEKNLFSLASPLKLTLDRKNQETLSAILKIIEDELTGTRDSHDEILKVLIMLFLLRLSECSATRITTNTNRDESLFVKKYLDLVQTHFLEWKRVSDYAAYLCVTPNYLNVKIKKITGYTAGYHIQQRVLLEAKRQARYHGLRMKQVAHYLGFDDVSHFSKYFKNGAGINFSSYLKADHVL